MNKGCYIPHNIAWQKCGVLYSAIYTSKGSNTPQEFIKKRETNMSLSLRKGVLHTERLLDESSRWIITIRNAETVAGHTVRLILSK